jgi:hypothetical protein
MKFGKKTKKYPNFLYLWASSACRCDDSCLFYCFSANFLGMDGNISYLCP